ncbi:hypothetical protein ACSBOB_29625 [Mesorhizobium sp. ASY16-5R]|uniref:hypothetical protein n=1 Tax=Mesorhizobium sp. ASY16-5R TaxID=3445772 RepID=UPI003FA12834
MTEQSKGASGPEIPILSGSIPKGGELTFFVAASAHGLAGGGHTHGFCVLVTDKDGNELCSILFRSRSKQSDNMRGELGATLTVLEFIEANEFSSVRSIVFSRAEYIYRWLGRNIKTWLKEPKRKNLDILRKIGPRLDRNAVHFANSDSAPLPEGAERALHLAQVAGRSAPFHFDEDGLGDAEWDALCEAASRPWE